MITRTATGYRTSGRVIAHTDQIVACHGSPSDQSMEATLGVAVRALTGATAVGRAGMLDGLHDAGHQVSQPWMGACYGSTVDPHGQGGGGIGVIDTVAPSGMVHLIGTSMGGAVASIWAAAHPSRVASLTLCSPLLDLLDLYDRCLGNPVTGPIATDIATCWGGSASATRATIATALTTAGATFDQLVAALAPLADRIWLVCVDDDAFGLAPAVEDFGAALGLPADRAVMLPAGGSSTHPAPYAPALGWDPLTTLRQVEAWA